MTKIEELYINKQACSEFELNFLRKINEIIVYIDEKEKLSQIFPDCWPEKQESNLEKCINDISLTISDEYDLKDIKNILSKYIKD